MEAMEQINTTDLTRFFQEVDAVSKKFEVEGNQANLLRRFDTILTQLLTPSRDSYGASVMRKTMEVRIAKLAIGLRLLQIQHGHRPDSLNDLTKADLVGSCALGFVVSSTVRFMNEAVR